MEAKPEVSYPDSGPVTVSNDGGPDVKSVSDSKLEGLGGAGSTPGRLGRAGRSHIGTEAMSLGFRAEGQQHMGKDQDF